MILAFNLWDTIVSVLAFVFALGLIIAIHEGGHFFFARKANILCREYAFGMGPLIWKKKKGETLYSIRALPIGGFCAIAGEELEEDPLKKLKTIKLVMENGKVKKLVLNDKNNVFNDLCELEIVEYDLFDANDSGNLFIKVIENGNEVTYPVDAQALYVFVKEVKQNSLSKQQVIDKYTEEIQIAPHNRTLGAKNKRQRAMVMFGGPLMNFVLAIVVFFVAALLMGFSDTSSSTLGEVSNDTPAYAAGLQENDKILELKAGSLSSGELKDWYGISSFMSEYKKEKDAPATITVIYLRDGETKSTEITPMVVIYSISMVQDLSDNANVKIGELSEQSLAYKGGLRTGDIIQSIKYNDKEKTSEYVLVSSWKDVYNIFTENEEGYLMTLKVLRGSETVECTVDPYSKELFEKTQSVETTAMLLGVSPRTRFNLGKSLIYPFTEFVGSLENMINTLGMLFFSKEVGVNDLSGPVGIFSLTSQAAKKGFGTLLNFIGFLSVNVGFMNLLPIPALDGGRLLFLGYEAVTKKKPSQKVETALISVTMILLLILIAYVSLNDILRLIGVK